MTRNTRPTRSRYTRRRGSMIVLAVGVLAVLAIVALSYTAAVRVERTGVQAFVNRIDGERQVDAVVGEIQALLTADLFGNKIVSGETPRYLAPNAALNTLTSVWPRMFEDGEYFDVPGVDNFVLGGGTYTFNTQPIGAPPSLGSVLGIEAGNIRYAPAISQDDAWLGSTEPVNAAAALNGVWDTWPTITNLRSAYRWGPDGAGGFAWIRSDGKFADLAQWFLSDEAERTGRGDPDADLTDFNDPISDDESGPSLGVNQRVFEYQMSAMQELYAGFNPQADEPLPLNHADSRFWADTDGDLRPDARWQQLESFGNLNGLRWVVAARIIDNSSMVNVNTALNAGRIDATIAAPDSPYDEVAAGRTPADVDLLRLLRSARFAPDLVTPNGTGWGALIANPDQWRMPSNGPNGSWVLYGGATGPYDIAFREQHMESQMRLHDVVNSFNLNFDNNNDQYDDYDPYAFFRPLRRYERDLLYVAAANAGEAFLGAGYGTPYSIDNEAELRAFWGVNREDTLSQVEQRFDAGYLPEQFPPSTGNFDSYTGAHLQLGPMRSADRQRNSRGLVLTVRDSDADSPLLRPTFQEIRDDLRRHITTVSGASYLSPVPVINPAIEGVAPDERPVYSEREPNLKIAFAEFPSIDNPGAISASKGYAVRRAFETLVWALAPLATNQPVAASLAPGQVGTNAQPSSYHYGGGAVNVDNPARAMITAGAPDPNSTYAMLRAASIAVNLADAIDNSAALDTDPTRDSPTIARLYPQSVTRSALVGVPSATLDAMDDAAMPILTTRFSHGDIPDPGTVPAGPPLPLRYVGQPATGVTLVGLDRQPFLREVASLAVYRDDLLEPSSVDPPIAFDGEIIAARLNEQLGSIIAFEIGNPWPRDINVRDYRLRLSTQNGARYIELDLSALVDADAVIAPGAYAVFYIYRGNPAWQLEWDSVLAQWEADVTARFGAATVQFHGFDADNAGTAVIFDGGMLPPGAVMFQDWSATGGLQSVALIIHDRADTTADPQVLVDRMSPPPGAAPFPSVMDDVYGGVYTIVADDLGGPAGSPVAGTGRVGVASSFTRRTRPPTVGVGAGPNERTGGFPAYVIERPEGGNDVSDPQATDNTWSVGNGPLPAPPVVVVGAPGNNLGPGPVGGGDVPKGDLPGMPSIQFFVPNRRPDAVGDLAMIGAFTHMFVHNADDPPADAWPPSAPVALATVPSIAGISEPDRWVTIGEQLGSNIHFTYDTQIPQLNGLAATNANPYLGVLDPTRFVLSFAGGDLSSVANIPDSLAIPLATRIYDGFEALGQPVSGDQLAEGRINVNTAPRRTLRMIPFMSPEQTIEWPVPNTYDGSMSGLLDAAGSPNPTYQADLVNDLDRAGLLGWYRDARRPLPPPSLIERSNSLNIPGLRSAGFANRPTDGVVAAGELSVLSFWDESNSAPTPANPTFAGDYRHFGELGQRLDPALNTRFNTGVSQPPQPALNPPNGPRPPHFELGAGLVDGVLDRFPNAIMEIEPGVTANLDPIDDAEERAAVYRAMSNIVSTRSDVFTAWFIIRGYDPVRIASIPFPQNFNPGAANEDELAALMNQLSPSHESRWLAVFDRSNVRTPTDRPRLLLLTRLPTR